MANPWKFLQMVKTWQNGDPNRRRRGRVVIIPMDEIEDDNLSKKSCISKKIRVCSESEDSDSAADASDCGSKIEGLVCMMRESPYRILKVAETGNLKEFEKLYLGDPERIKIKDLKGRNVLHAAASKNRNGIMQFALQHGADINAQDENGNTALHAAVEHEAFEAIEFLIKGGADTSVYNKKKQAAIHLATELNKVSVLKILVEHKDKVDILQKGEHGRTVLHLVAMLDLPECTEIILQQFKSCINTPCDNGYYPIHEATKNASAKTLEVLLRWGESIGCSRNQMMHFKDTEGNDALHSAVNGGDLKAVQLCLENGAKINSQQHNLSTPVHLACSQGSLDVIKLMFQMQPEEKSACLSLTDVQKMTPLHCAAMFDHVDIVEYLVAEGANIEALDKEQRSPLLLAASRGGWRTLNVLLRVGADTTVRDVSNRNVFHFIVMQGGCLEEFALSMRQFHISFADKLNEKDTTGCTPMHYASREGYFRSIESLIKLGATINMKDNNHQSPLHFAASYGRYNTVRKLLQSDKGPFIINQANGEGQTALHIASFHGHTRVVRLLLARGALLHKDHDGRTPFHLAALNGYTETMDMLVCIHSHLLDQTDKDGNTALHLAAKANKAAVATYLLNMNCKISRNTAGQTPLDIVIICKHNETAMAITTHDERSEEALQSCSSVFDNLPQALITHMPDVFTAVLDKSIVRAPGVKREAKNYYIKYNFKFLQWPQECIQKLLELETKAPPPLPAVNAMVQNGRVELLTHPVTQQYLQMKWDTYGMYFHLANLFVYIIFLFFVTMFSSSVIAIHRVGLTGYVSTAEYRSKPMCYVNATVITVFVIMNLLKEFFQFYQQRIKYLLDPINLLEWILYVTAGIMVWPVYFNDEWEYQIVAAAIAVFLAWFNFLLYLQRFNRVGIYVVMFLEILKTLLKVLLLFSILIIAFGLAFYILMSKNDHASFYTVPLSLLRIFSMMLGEIDFLGSYVGPLFASNETSTTSSFGKHGTTTASFLPFPEISLGFLVIFMVFMPILLMNLLIGLAVGDIESVRRNAQLKRIAMQVELHTELERKLPQILVKRVNKEEVVVYPNNPGLKCPVFWALIEKHLGCGMASYTHAQLPDTVQEDDVYFEELCKQKLRLKELARSLEQQHQLLRLIVQKMEIRTEADDFDEGVDLKKEQGHLQGSSGSWKSSRLTKKLKSSMVFARHVRKPSLAETPSQI